MILVIVFLLIIVICVCGYFIINSHLQFLYHVVSACDDLELSFVGADEQQ